MFLNFAGSVQHVDPVGEVRPGFHFAGVSGFASAGAARSSLASGMCLGKYASRIPIVTAMASITAQNSQLVRSHSHSRSSGVNVLSSAFPLGHWSPMGFHPAGTFDTSSLAP
jgi:hypothetical protein